MRVERLGEVISAKDIPSHIANNNINGPTVFQRPPFFPQGPRWIMYFAHHGGKGIRVAHAEELEGPWEVQPIELLELSRIEGHGHIASPEVIVNKDSLELYYHCPYADFQYTFRAITKDGINWEYDPQVKGMFYLRFIQPGYAVAKYRNDGGVLYKVAEGTFKEVGRLLPSMRHCSYLDGKLYWTNIGDTPERIFRGDINPVECLVSNIEEVLAPLEDFETGKHRLAPSRPGAAIRVNQVRDPFVIQENGKTYLFYSVRGEEAIALAVVEE